MFILHPLKTLGAWVVFYLLFFVRAAYGASAQPIALSLSEANQNGVNACRLALDSDTPPEPKKTGYEVELPLEALIPFLTTDFGTLEEIVDVLHSYPHTIYYPLGMNHSHQAMVISDLHIDKEAIARKVGATLASEMKDYVQYADSTNANIDDGVEIHFISTRRFGEIRKDIDSLVAIAGADSFSLHAHLVSGLPLAALHEDPELTAAYLTFESTMANTVAEMFSVVIGRTPISDLHEESTEVFGSLRAERFQYLLTYLLRLGTRSERTCLVHRFLKIGWVGVRTHGTYHEDASHAHETIPDLDWGWEIRAFDPKADPRLQNGLIEGLRDRHSALSRLRVADVPSSFRGWLSDAKRGNWRAEGMDIRMKFLASLHYNRDWDEIKNQAPAGLYREAARAFTDWYQEDQEINPAQFHQEVKMLFFNWQNSPYGQMFPESTRQFDSMRKDAVRRIYQGHEDPVSVVRDLLIKSGLFDDLLNSY